MTTNRNDGKARSTLAFLMLLGLGSLSIPFFLVPPAYLDLALTDAVFGANLSGKRIVATDDASGRIVNASIEKVDGSYVARIGRINSGNGAVSIRLPDYKLAVARYDAGPLQRVRVPLELAPTFGRLEVTPVNATVAGEAVPATFSQGNTTLTSEPQRTVTIDLAPGRHRLTARANGFCPSEREFDIREGKVTRAQLPISPDLKPDEIARFVLGWPHEPSDLDSHFRKAGTTGSANPTHLYFRRRESRDLSGNVLARLDVDMRQPNGYETVTVRDKATGEFEYYVHLYAGFGTLGDSAATVQVYTRGCSVKTLNVPPGCARNVWSVGNLRYEQGSVQLSERQQCESGGILQLGGKTPLI